MDQLRYQFLHTRKIKGEGESGKLHTIAREIAELGRFNFLFSNSKYLIAYNDNRNNDELFYTLRECLCEEGNTIQYVAVIATSPTTKNEKWIKFAPDELLTFVDGRPIK